jgi:hypothetical protein
MLSQRRRLLIWTQYKFELTVCNNFNRTTVTETVKVYIKVIGITKIEIIKKFLLSGYCVVRCHRFMDARNIQYHIQFYTNTKN